MHIRGSLCGHHRLHATRSQTCKSVRSVQQRVANTQHPQRLHLCLPASRKAPPVCAAAAAEGATGAFFSGEDFYTILGLDPTADAKDVKKAYYQMMREFHPDRSTSDETTELCALLNQIYETLSDPEQRATYDAIAGFSGSSVNPFLDTSFPRDQVFVDEVTCIGCGKCVRACPATFEIEASKFGRARVIAQGADVPDDIQIAIESCPVDCIHWVSLPQLSLLETALANMARVEVYIMLRGFRQGGNVFETAFKSWQKRQELIQAKARQAVQSRAQVKVDWSFWTASTFQYEEATEDAYTASKDPTQRKIANLAAAAARAARLWKVANANRVVEPKAVLAENSSMSSVDV